MAKITFDIPDKLLPLVIESFCGEYNYQAEIQDPDNVGKKLPNTQTPAQFTQQCFVRYGKEVVKSHQVKKASELARQQAHDEANKILDGANITIDVS